MKRIHVVAAVIWNTARNKILITKRPAHLHKGGYWEFPGGKVEAGESLDTALARELKEELTIEFDQCSAMQSLSFDYPDKKVFLEFFHVYDLRGDPVANEGQEMAWVASTELGAYQFPEANEPIVKALMPIQG